MPSPANEHIAKVCVSYPAMYSSLVANSFILLKRFVGRVKSQKNKRVDGFC